MIQELLPEPVTEADAGYAPPAEPDDAPALAPPVEAAVPPLVVPDASAVLIEVRGDMGIVLGRALRDVVGWAAAPAAERAGVFGPGAAATRRASLARTELARDLAVPVELVAELVANPGATQPLLVMHACLRVAQHLRRMGAGGAALAFARAALLTCPDHPRALLEVARLVGPTHADEARVLLLRAAAHKDEGRQPDLGAEIHAELAALAFQRRDTRGARGHLLTATRAVRAAARLHGAAR